MLYQQQQHACYKPIKILTRSDFWLLLGYSWVCRGRCEITLICNQKNVLFPRLTLPNKPKSTKCQRTAAASVSLFLTLLLVSVHHHVAAPPSSFALEAMTADLEDILEPFLPALTRVPCRDGDALQPRFGRPLTLLWLRQRRRVGLHPTAQVHKKNNNKKRRIYREKYEKKRNTAVTETERWEKQRQKRWIKRRLSYVMLGEPSGWSGSVRRVTLPHSRPIT